MSDKLRIETPLPHVRLLVINRPEMRNALDRETYQLLSKGIAQAEADRDIHVTIVSGADNCFTSGNDLKDFTTPDHVGQSGKSPGLELLLTLHNAQKPLVAAIETFAVGIGTTMLNHFDLAYCGKSARFRVPFVPLGLSPEGGSTFYFPQMAGYKKANELLLLGEFFSADDALRYHFVNDVVEDGRALEKALEQAEKLSRLPLHSIMATKKMLKKRNHQIIEAILEDEARTFHELRNSDETQKLISGFFNKKD